MAESLVQLTPEVIAQLAGEAVFGKPLVTNTYRGLIAEVIVQAALPPGWNWCSADYAPVDFEHMSGLGLEVKQSAARQSWLTRNQSASRGSFDIAARSHLWDGEAGRWVHDPGRRADIYVFAYHPLAGEDADHRDPAQWRFRVVPTLQLPATRRLTLKGLKHLCPADVGFDELGRRVETLTSELLAERSSSSLVG